MEIQNYKQKYIKYKTKYLSHKEKYIESMQGGDYLDRRDENNKDLYQQNTKEDKETEAMRKEMIAIRAQAEASRYAEVARQAMRDAQVARYEANKNKDR